MQTTNKRHFAFVRSLQKGGGANLKTISDIKSAERHAKRLDQTSKRRQRPDASHEDNYFRTNLGEGLKNKGANYFEAYKAHKSQYDVKSERKNAALAIHLLVGVSPEWLLETGSPHDLDNPRVQALIERAEQWAESWMGKGAVWAVRYDVDEVGSGIVDIIGSPIRTAHHKSGSSKPSISINKALTELVGHVNDRRLQDWCADGNDAASFKKIQKSFRAMQDSWAWFAQEHLSPTLERGDPIEETRRKHLFPEEFKQAIEGAQKVEEFDLRKEDEVRNLIEQRQALDKEKARQDREIEKQRAETERLLRQQAAAEEELKRIRKAQRAEAERHRRLTDEVAELDAKRKELSSVEAALAKARGALSEAQTQAAQIISLARSQADDILNGAREQARQIGTAIVQSWEELRQVPSPIKTATIRANALRTAIKSFFARVPVSEEHVREIADEYSTRANPEDIIEVLTAKQAEHDEALLNTLPDPGMTP